MGTASVEELQLGLQKWGLGRPRSKPWEDGGQTSTKYILSIQGRNVSSSPSASREHGDYASNITNLLPYGKSTLGTSTAGTYRQVSATPASHWEISVPTIPSEKGSSDPSNASAGGNNG